MKSIFRLSLSLLGNQLVASVGGGMCVMFVLMLAGTSIWSHILFLCITLPFFIYIEYRAAFKFGFHDPDRRNNPNSKAYLIKGALAGLISAIPLIGMLVFYLIAGMSDTILVQYATLYTRIISMYYSWPMCNIFPNHITTVFISAVILLIILPFLGYLAGYKNIMITDPIIKKLGITIRKK